MKRKALFQKVRDLGGFNVKNLKERLIDYVKENVESSDFQVDHNFLARDIRLLLNKGKVKFQKHVRHYDTFFEKENRWLDSELVLKQYNKRPSLSGRPTKMWDELGKHCLRSLLLVNRN